MPAISPLCRSKSTSKAPSSTRFITVWLTGTFNKTSYKKQKENITNVKPIKMNNKVRRSYRYGKSDKVIYEVLKSTY